MSRAQNIQLIAFDVDGTLVEATVHIWENLHRHFGCDARRREEARRAHFAGELSYQAWFEHDIVLLQQAGADQQGVMDCLDALRPVEGAHDCLRELQLRGYKLAVISGSLDMVLQKFFPDVPFAHVLINHFDFDAQGRLAGGTHTPYDIEGKAAGLRELARREGLRVEQCAFVGDNLNDLQALELAGFSVAVQPKDPRVVEAADLAMPGRDLRALLDYFAPLAQAQTGAASR